MTPTSANDVSAAVIVLKQGNCSFAVRGGGHTPFAGAANIEDGVTIDLGSMIQVTVNQHQTITSVGAGARWGNVYSKLDAMNLTVSGGRVSNVGVAGLTLGGTSKHSERAGALVVYEHGQSLTAYRGTILLCTPTRLRMRWCHEPRGKQELSRIRRY